MPIHLRTEPVQDLIAAHHLDMDGLVATWKVLAATRAGFPSERQKSSIYRWLAEGLPSRGDEVVALCALLEHV